jgi:NADH dehydrogenase
VKVAVTGGTGFVGREVVRQLRGAGHEVDLLTRVTLADANTCATPLRGCDAVIHLVGIISEVGEQTYENVHTRLTERIVSAAKLAGVKRFLHMSALGTRANATARYHQTKWAAEEVVRASELDWTIFRPSIIYGPDDGFVNLFARIAKFSPIVPLIGGGRTKFQPVSVENVARGFVSSLTESRAVGKTFDLCDGEVLTLRDIVETMLTVTKRRRLKIPLPFGVARVQAALAEFFFARVLGKAPPLNRDQLVMLHEDNVGEGRAANDLFGLRHAPFAEGIGRYLNRDA